MRNRDAKWILLASAFLISFVAINTTLVQEPQANVAGNWTIYSKGPDDSYRTQVMQIRQERGVITGHYRGPGLEGELEGTINIFFSYQDSHSVDLSRQGRRPS